MSPNAAASGAFRLMFMMGNPSPDLAGYCL
jgi:hypothetical protein